MPYRFFILILICCLSNPIGLYAQCNQWQSISSGTTNLLRAVHFPNAQNGWAVGSGGTLLRSQDGGATWASQSTALGAGGRELYSVHFANAKVFFPKYSNFRKNFQKTVYFRLVF